MPVVGQGLDLVETARIGRLIDRHGRVFLDRVYTPAEQAYCEANPRRRVEHYAVRFAAKEAILKALGTGLTGGIRWTDAHVVRLPSGRPTVGLEGVAQTKAEDLGARSWLLSLTHVGPMAAASVIAQTEPSSP
ncbi:MAG: holo-ACP synthase [Planctomycetota bacterium]